MVEALHTVKITTGSPKLAARLKTDILLLLDGYTKTFKDAGEVKASEAAMGRIRIITGAK